MFLFSEGVTACGPRSSYLKRTLLRYSAMDTCDDTTCFSQAASEANPSPHNMQCKGGVSLGSEGNSYKSVPWMSAPGT